ncbi:FAD-dependent monooxygenase [Nocardia sp. CA-135953]|uniref:FAD-dependent monooxygenase n=1 Tax=Nocardia sp. CA-135953 TaxID=3239978 RepID=UPI003D955D2C
MRSTRSSAAEQQVRRHRPSSARARAAAGCRCQIELTTDLNLAALVRHADPESVHNTTMRTAKPLPHWETGPVTLMGDAIHTMIPAGSSAGTALRDAALLCRRITARTGSLRDAVHAYETEMLDYGFAMVERSLRSAS